LHKVSLSFDGEVQPTRRKLSRESAYTEFQNRNDSWSQKSERLGRLEDDIEVSPELSLEVAEKCSV
jgi:hypothetical protein